MLLPYYIASMNIEHAYLEAMDQYRPFEGICLVDTFTTLGQANFFTSENTARIRRQSGAPIRVVIGNPPYNMGQANENEQNKNRRYLGLGEVDTRIAKTYVKDSTATLRNKLSDPYVKAFRWASDRIKDHGIVCYVTNNSFVDQIAFDGMRKHLGNDFSKLYILNLGGNVRHNPSLSGTTHNVFGIQVGVAISILIRSSAQIGRGEILYSETPASATKQMKFNQLNEWGTLGAVKWEKSKISDGQSWVSGESNINSEFADFIPLGNKVTKHSLDQKTIFVNFSLGVASSRDTYNYNESVQELRKNIERAVNTYNETLDRYRREDLPRPSPDSYVDTSDPAIKWTRQTKALLGRLVDAKMVETDFRISSYRPFRKLNSYFEDFWNEERYQLHRFFPTLDSENIAFAASGVGAERPFAAFSSAFIPDLNFFGPGTVPNWFPFYTYDEDGSHRRENITDWALEQYRTHYKSKSITKWDIFHSTYALLHHPEYRTRYAANLKRELPRIPFPPDLCAFADAGKRLMQLHVDYEKQLEYPLEEIETPKVPFTLRVEKMSLSKDKTELRYNQALTLRGIPPAAFDYRLGNRSALEWVIDQYRVSTDSRSGITNDPNRPDDERYILRLIGQVITVSLETMKIVNALPSLEFPNP
jgi:predicted helicase